VQWPRDAAGTIGVLSNGAALVMATVDQLVDAGGQCCCYVNIGGETDHALTPTQFADRCLAGLQQLAQQPQVEVILVNVMTGVSNVAELMQCLQTFDQALLSPGLASSSLASVAANVDRVVPLQSWRRSTPLCVRLYCGGAVMPLPRLRFQQLRVQIYAQMGAAIAAVIQDTASAQ
jgi:succinyl-CoA synthetase beta subunit